MQQCRVLTKKLTMYSFAQHVAWNQKGYAPFAHIADSAQSVVGLELGAHAGKRTTTAYVCKGIRQPICSAWGSYVVMSSVAHDNATATSFQLLAGGNGTLAVTCHL